MLSRPVLTAIYNESEAAFDDASTTLGAQISAMTNTIAGDYTRTNSPCFTFPRTDDCRPRAPIQVAPIPGF